MRFDEKVVGQPGLVKANRSVGHIGDRCYPLSANHTLGIYVSTCMAHMGMT
jgi:hypothetical protein